jgi:aminoglycoside 3-N-acetyltransferase I
MWLIDPSMGRPGGNRTLYGSIVQHDALVGEILLPRASCLKGIMSAPLDIRRLGPADLALLRALNVLFGDAFGDSETYTRQPPADTYLTEVLAKEHVIALAAIAGDHVVGGLVAYELDKFERARREMYIYDLAVAEQHRRQGIATALIEHLQSIAAQRAAWVVYVQADYGDNAAIALYEKIGTREDVMHFDIPVTGGSK